MIDAFLYVFNMGITASYLVLAIVLVRFLFKKLPKWSFCVMWGMVALRLIFPVSFNSLLSLIPTTQTLSHDAVFSHSTINPTGTDVFNYMGDEAVSYSVSVENGSIALDNFVATDAVYANPLYLVTYIASILWIVGFVGMLLYSFISYIRLYKRVKPSLLYRDNIYYCDNISTPFILGIIKPKIYIPSHLDETAIEYVTSHEKAHLKRLDHIWKPIGFALLSVYWFNPVIWVAYILLCRDIEKACDEKVIKNKENSYKKGYSEALLSCATERKMILACPLAFGEVGVKERIKSVLSYKKPAFWVVVIAVVLSLFMGVGFLTNPAATASDIIEENGYMIYSNNRKNITLKIPSDVISERMNKVGKTSFLKNKYVVYETESSKIYLDNVTRYEDNNRIYLGFDFSYNKLTKSGSVLVGYYKDGVGYPSALELNDSSIIIGEEKVLDAVDLTSWGPSGYFELAFDIDKLENAQGDILVDFSCHEIGYAKEGWTGDYSLERKDFSKDVLLQPVEVVMYNTTRGTVYDFENLPVFELSQGMYLTEVKDGNKYIQLGEMEKDWQGKYDLSTRMLSAIWVEGYSQEEFYHNIKEVWELEHQGTLYTLFEMYNAELHLAVGSYNSGAGMDNDDDSYYKEIYKLTTAEIQTVYTFENSNEKIKPQFILNHSDKTFQFKSSVYTFSFSGEYELENGVLTLTGKQTPFINEKDEPEYTFVFYETEKGYKFNASGSSYSDIYGFPGVDEEYVSVPDGTEFVGSVQKNIINENFEQRFIFPNADMLGDYNSTNFKHYENDSLVFSTDIYVLTVDYSENNFEKAKELWGNMYKYEDEISDLYNGQFESGDFIFKLVDSEEYALTGVPKEMVFAGYSDLRKQLIFICYCDQDLDYIHDNDFDEFLHIECPEIFDYDPVLKGSEIEKITITTQPADEKYEKVFTSPVTVSRLCAIINDAQKCTDYLGEPGDYNGMTVNLNLQNKDGSVTEIVVFSGLFIKYDNSGWMMFMENEGEELLEFIFETSNEEDHESATTFA